MVRATFKRGAKFARWVRNLNDPSVALKQVGALMVAESQRAFKRQKFGKKKWPPRAPTNVFGIIADFAAGKASPPNRRFETRPALKDTGRLSASIAFRVIGKREVEVGSRLRYASVHHTGGEVESKRITKAVQELLGRWLQKQGSAMRDRLGWLLSPKLTGKTLKATVPERPIVGITKQTERDVLEVVRVKIMEVR